MRVYVPSTLPGLVRLARDGRLEGSTAAAFAVTAEVQAAHAWDDEEEAEYAVLLVAADASLDLLRADPAAPRRRVVVAGDVDPGQVVPTTGPAVTLAAPLRRDQVAAVLVDDAAATEAIRHALNGGPPLADGPELQWFATQELDFLLDP